MHNRWKYIFIVSILLIPLFFINVKDSHDWGDDFAQYLIQARNIIEGREQSDNGLLQNVNDPAFAIEAYPVGFPLLLAPIYYFFKLEILPYCILNSFLLFFTGLISFEFFRRRTNVFTAIVITLLFCFNPNTIDLKKQILSEITFTCLFMFSLFWLESNLSRKRYSWIITGLILAYLISIRLAGIAFVAGYILFELITIRKLFNTIERKIVVRKLFLTISAIILFFLLLNEILFPIKSGGLFNFYTSAFQNHELQFSNNLTFYYKVSQYLFPFFSSWVPSFWILLAIFGWVIRFVKSPTLCEYIFPIYLLLIIFYPYANAGLRFIIPVLPLLIYYTWYLIHTSLSRIEGKLTWISSALLSLFLVAYFGPVKEIISNQSSLEDGPQQKVAVELFNYLKKTPVDAAIVFCKARAMSLYSGHPALYTTKDQSPEEAYIQFHRYKLLYLVITKANPDNEIYDQRLLDYIGQYNKQYEHVWENEHFNIYRQK